MKLNTEKVHNTKIQISQMLYFSMTHKKVDIVSAEDILLHTNVLELLYIYTHIYHFFPGWVVGLRTLVFTRFRRKLNRNETNRTRAHAEQHLEQ